MKQRICVLAVSRTRGNKICIAGVNEQGEWVRPVKSDDPKNRFWIFPSEETPSIGNTIEMEGNWVTNQQSSLHTEDFITNHIEIINLQDQIFNGNYDAIISNHEELISMCKEESNRSLALIRRDSIQIANEASAPENNPRLRCYLNDDEFLNPVTRKGDYPLNDQETYNRFRDYINPLHFITLNTRYVTIGLALPWKDKDNQCFPQVVGVIE